jgi:transposase
VLTALPGIGQFTALVILAEIGDISRFDSARKLAAWAGLTPTVRGSDLTIRYGHISKQGSAWLRWILCEAAQTAKQHPEFAASYAAMARRRGKKIATTAVARKLLTRAYHLLTEADEPRRGQPTRNSTTRPPTTRTTRPTTTRRTSSHRPGTVTHPGRARVSA